MKVTGKGKTGDTGKMNRKNALGRGLGALIPSYGEEKVDNPPENFTEDQNLSTISVEKVDKSVESPNRVLLLPLSQVEPREGQPRQIFNEEGLSELAESIRIHGLIQPILVTKKEDHYEIVAGERRWRAAKLAGLKKIPAVLGDYSARTVSELSLIENIQREDLNPIEEAQAYRQLIKEYGLKQEDLAVRLARSRSAIANSLRLLKLDERVQAMIMEGRLSEGHARALLAVGDKKKQFDLADEIVEKKLSVRETERLVRQLLEPASAVRRSLAYTDQTAYDELVQSLRRSLGTKVNIRRSDKDKGQLVIDYYSVDELERIAEKLK